MSVRTIISNRASAILVLSIQGIQYNPEWSFGDVMQVIVASLVLLGLVPWCWRQLAKRQLFDIRFVEKNAPFPKLYAYSGKDPKKGTADVVMGLGEFHVRIRAKAGIRIRDIGFRLVRRQVLPNKPLPLPLWAWRSIRPDIEGVKLVNLWDAEVERQQKDDPDHQSRPRPLSQADGTGGYRMQFTAFDQSMPLLVNDSLWIRVIVSAQQSWQGHLEFQGPANDGRRAYARRIVQITRPTSDAVGPQQI